MLEGLPKWNRTCSVFKKLARGAPTLKKPSPTYWTLKGAKPTEAPALREKVRGKGEKGAYTLETYPKRKNSNFQIKG